MLKSVLGDLGEANDGFDLLRIIGIRESALHAAGFFLRQFQQKFVQLYNFPCTGQKPLVILFQVEFPQQVLVQVYRRFFVEFFLDPSRKVIAEGVRVKGLFGIGLIYSLRQLRNGIQIRIGGFQRIQYCVDFVTDFLFFYKITALAVLTFQMVDLTVHEALVSRQL